jgi:putative addiction module killer protein
MGLFDRFEVIRSDEFVGWLSHLRDNVARQAVESRILRLEHGNFGDAKAIGEGISELRIHAGPGYRVYFIQHGYRVIVLLCAGDKGSQTRDMAAARHIASRFKEG